MALAKLPTEIWAKALRNFIIQQKKVRPFKDHQ
jgi:hypothetical protein